MLRPRQHLTQQPRDPAAQLQQRRTGLRHPAGPRPPRDDDPRHDSPPRLPQRKFHPSAHALQAQTDGRIRNGIVSKASKVKKNVYFCTVLTIINMIEIEDFDKVEMRVGTVVEVKENRKARHPAYAVTIDFGPEIGLKKSSAQITTLYTPEELLGKQVICCVNLQPMHIGSVKSEVRILGSDSEQGVVLLRPTQAVKNGDRIF